MTTENNEIDTLVAEPTPLTLASGFEVKVERLRTRALMSLLKILTRGAADVMAELRFNESEDAQSFAAQLMGAVFLSIPEAEDETIQFVNRMVVPAGLKEGGRLTKAAIEENLKLEAELREQLQDPELEDLLTIVSEIIRVEAPHVMALGKRLATLIEVQQKSAASKQGGSSQKSSRA